MIYIVREAPTSKVSPCLTSHPLWPAGGFAEQQHVCIRAAGLWQYLLLDYSLRDMRRCTIMMKRVSSNAAAFGSMVMHNAQPKAVMLQRSCGSGARRILRSRRRRDADKGRWWGWTNRSRRRARRGWRQACKKLLIKYDAVCACERQQGCLSTYCTPVSLVCLATCSMSGHCRSSSVSQQAAIDD